VDAATVPADAADLALRFIDALNNRDSDAVIELVTDDTEFRNPKGGAVLRGYDGARALVAAAADMSLRLLPKGDPELANDGRVAVPLRVIAGSDEVHGTAFLEVRDGKLAAFEVVTEVV
jgi:hypothetical protein